MTTTHDVSADQPDDSDVRADGGTSERRTVEFGLEDRPPLGRSILLGTQHYLTMVGSNIAVPLALAGAMAAQGADPAIARLVGTFFVVAGVATLLQTTIGNRYPLVQGASFAILAPGLAIIGTLGAQGVSNFEAMILELQGAMIVAGAVQIVIGYAGLFGYLKRFLSPVVVAPIIALIGLSLFNVPQITQAEQSLWLIGLTLVLIILFSQYLGGYSRVIKLYPVLLGLLAAWIIAAVLSVSGVVPEGSSAYVDISAATEPSMIQPIVPFQWGMPEFTAAFVVGMFAGVLASMIESFGDYYAVARISGEKAPSSQRINHGLGMEGIGNLFAGIMGTGNGSTSYSENIGAIGITNVASRYVVQVGGVIMIIAGYIGVVGGFVQTIPDPIVGGLFVVMFAQIVGVGISQLQHVDLNQNRNVFIIGLVLLTGLSVPAYASQFSAPSVEQALAELAVLGPVMATEIAGVGIGELLAQVLVVVGGTGVAVGLGVGFLLDNTIPASREHRGLAAWERLTEEDSDFEAIHERLLTREEQPSHAKND